MGLRSSLNYPRYVSPPAYAWAEKDGICLEYIHPVNPQQNAYVERYNLRFRYDWLGHYLFESIGARLFSGHLAICDFKCR